MAQPEKVIFAIDNNTDVHAVAKFMRHIDTCRAMNTLKGSFTQCIGYWDGILEPSYMMDKVDYDKLVLPLGFTQGQDCVLVVPGDTRQPCHLEFPNDDPLVVGRMVEISKDEAKTANAWTFVQSTGKYFTTV